MVCVANSLADRAASNFSQRVRSTFENIWEEFFNEMAPDQPTTQKSAVGYFEAQDEARLESEEEPPNA